MVSKSNECPNCSTPIRYNSVSLHLRPLGVACPSCGATLASVSFTKLPPLGFLALALALGLAVGVGFGAAITVLSREWTLTSRLIVLAVSLLGGVTVFMFSRNLVPRPNHDD